jgi:hypothetical protein
MVLSIASISDRHHSAKASAPLDFQGTVVGLPGLAKVDLYMAEELAESALLIASTVLSNDYNSHRHPQWQFAPTTSAPPDSRRSDVGPQGLNIMEFYMSRTLAESALLIAATVLSND